MSRNRKKPTSKKIRNKSRTYYREKPPKRDIKTITKRRRLLRRYKSNIFKHLEETQDRRFKLDDLTVYGTPALVVPEEKTIIPENRYNYRRYMAKYHRPDETITCIRRKRRKQVLHALKKTGKGSGGGKKHFNEKSKIRC